MPTKFPTSLKHSARGLATFFVAAVATSGHVLAAPTFNYVELPFNATHINNQGQIIGTAGGQTVMWQSGSQSVIGSYGAPKDLNNNGQVLFDSGIWDATNGLVTHDFTGAQAFNDLGQVVGGSLWDGTGAPPTAFLWHESTGINYFPESTDRGDGGDPIDINNSSQVLFAVRANGPPGFVWNGPEDSYDLTAGVQDGPGTTLNGYINDHGNVARIRATGGADAVNEDLPPGPGYSDGCGTMCFVAEYWAGNAPGSYLGLLGITETHWGPPLGGLNANIFGLNNKNEVVGAYLDYSDYLNGVPILAFIASAPEKFLDLNTLINLSNPLPEGTLLQVALGINDSTQVIALGSDGKSYLLTAVPVPAAAWLFGSALGVVGAMRRTLTG